MNFLKGKKTIVTGIISVLWGAVEYAYGGDGSQKIMLGLTAIFLRKGMNNGS